MGSQLLHLLDYSEQCSHCSWLWWIGPGDPWPICSQSDLSLGIWEFEVRSIDMRIHAAELGWWPGAAAHVHNWSSFDPTTFKLTVQLLLGFSDAFIHSINHSLTFKLSWVDFCDLGLEAPSVRPSESQQTPLQASVLSEGNPFLLSKTDKLVSCKLRLHELWDYLRVETKKSSPTPHCQSLPPKY